MLLIQLCKMICWFVYCVVLLVVLLFDLFVVRCYVKFVNEEVNDSQNTNVIGIDRTLLQSSFNPGD